MNCFRKDHTADWKVCCVVGVVSAVLVFLAAKNDYRKTYIASYKESNGTRLRIAEHLRKLPMSFFNTKDLSELTTNMMADCSSMESLLSSTIPPLIANGITVTLTCVLLAFFDWRLALCVFITVPLAFLIIWLSRKRQRKLFARQLDAKLAASGQVQEYLEGMKIIKSCGMSGARFHALDRALLAMKRIAVKVEMAVGVFMSSASAFPSPAPCSKMRRSFCWTKPPRPSILKTKCSCRKPLQNLWKEKPS